MRRWMLTAGLVVVSVLGGLAGCASVPLVAATAPIGGSDLSCSSLPSAFDAHVNANDRAHFSNWTDTDYDAARQLVRVCAPNYSRKVTAQRLVAIAALQRSYDTRLAAARARGLAFEACVGRPPYQRYWAVQRIRAALRQWNHWRHVLANERAIGRISGVVNMETEHTAGVEMLQARNTLKDSWAAYVQAGGRAATPENLPRHLSDPCAS